MSIQFTVALMIAVWELLRLQPEHTEALPAIVITMVLLWLYLAFTSYFIVWSGNLASLVGWYQVRSHGGWGIAIGICTVIEVLADRKSGVLGQSVSVRVDLGGRRIIKKKIEKKYDIRH